jgi:hypothetical protein
LEPLLFQNSTPEEYYGNCLYCIDGYISLGKDEEKKKELRMMKIKIEDSADYQKKKQK